jgi:hypothetical protein
MAKRQVPPRQEHHGQGASPLLDSHVYRRSGRIPNKNASEKRLHPPIENNCAPLFRASCWRSLTPSCLGSSMLVCS